MKSIVIFLILSQIFALKPLKRKSLARNGTEEIANNNATNPETVNNSTEIVLPAVIKTDVPGAKNPVVVSEVVNPAVVPEVINPEVVNPEVVNPEVVNPEVVNWEEPIFHEENPDFGWYDLEDPIHSSYTPYSIYYDCYLFWDPIFCDSYYRKNQLKAGNNLKSAKKNERRALKTEDIEKQIKSLKKEIFGKENYSTKELRKNNKAYDPRWLVAQLKVARLLFLEDEINKNRK